MQPWNISDLLSSGEKSNPSILRSSVPANEVRPGMTPKQMGEIMAKNVMVVAVKELNKAFTQIQQPTAQKATDK